MKSSRSRRAIFPFKELRAVGKFMIAVRAITKNMADHPLLFVTPEPPLANVNANLDEMEKAQAIAGTHVQGAAAARNIKYDKVLRDVWGLQAYVTRLASHAANEAESITIIECAGFRIRKKGVHVKPKLSAKQGDVPGRVKLVAVSQGRKVSYHWQISMDGKEWHTTATTLVAKCNVQCMPGTKVHFRLHAIRSNGSEYISHPVSIFVK